MSWMTKALDVGKTAMGGFSRGITGAFDLGATGLAKASVFAGARDAAWAGTASKWLGSASNAVMKAGQNPYIRSAAVGAVGGGIYGAFSDNTSVLGGMLGGAALGAGGRGLFNAGRYGARTYGNMRNVFGLGRGEALASTFSAMADRSKSLIGNTLTKAGNAFRAR